jgi:predicted nucleic acid-binding protein
LLENIYSGTPFVVPVLWIFEVVNSLLVLARRRIIDGMQCARARQTILHLRPVIDDEGPDSALAEISRLAEKFALSAYDAVYLEVALRRGLPLASRDRALNEAAKLSGVKTLLDGR